MSYPVVLVPVVTKLCSLFEREEREITLPHFFKENVSEFAVRGIPENTVKPGLLNKGMSFEMVDVNTVCKALGYEQQFFGYEQQFFG